MKRDFVLSGALHALVLTGLLLWGAGWIETPRVPSAITVALIDRTFGAGWNIEVGSRVHSARDLRLVGSPTPAVKSVAPAPVAPRPVSRPAANKRDWSAPRPVAAPAAPEVSRPRSSLVEDRSQDAGRSTLQTAVATGASASPDASRDSGGAAAGGAELDRRMAIIRSRIQDALVYPREARRRGIEGTAQVRFDLKEDGRLRSVELAASSGRGLLDDASIETVRRAQPFPYVEGALQVPVVFRLTGN